MSEHLADLADAQIEHTLNIARMNVRSELQGLGADFCEDCDEEIPAPRRAAYPSATRCVACQEAHERRMGR